MNKLINGIRQDTERPETIESFEYVTIRISGMRYAIEYEAVQKGNEAEVAKYGLKFVDGKEKRTIELKNTCEKERILKLMNDCDLLSWDGFTGSHPEGVLDGIMFTMDAIINSRKIHATGSENFPQHYDEFTGGLFGIIKEDEEEDDE